MKGMMWCFFLTMIGKASYGTDAADFRKEKIVTDDPGSDIPSNFGIGVPAVTFLADKELTLFNHTVSSPTRHGVLSHVWHVATGQGEDFNTTSGIAIFRFYIDDDRDSPIELTGRQMAMMHFDPNTAGSAPTPWGTQWFGRVADKDSFYHNIPIPFRQSIRVTAQLPPNALPQQVFFILRGRELPIDVPAVVIGNVPLPITTRLRVDKYDNPAMPSLDFVPLVNRSTGSGVIFAHGIAMSTTPWQHNSFAYLEGCFHLFSPWQPIDADHAFPGIVLSTGMEDFYDSSFYFHSGKYQLPHTGVTHMCCGVDASYAAFPQCNAQAKGKSQFSAYHVHIDDGGLWFRDGVQLVVRNGGVIGDTPLGRGKCFNLAKTGGSPIPTEVHSWAWVYEF